MRILFLHRNFPGQFRHLANHLAQNKNNQVVFLTNRKDINLPDIAKITYDLHRGVKQETHPYLKFYDECILHGQGALRELLKLKEQGFVPDVIIGHAWGQTLFIKDVYPNVPYIANIEWFFNSKNSNIDFIQEPTIDAKALFRIKNSHILIDLCSCDLAMTATNWQLQQIPKEFHNKISVIHEGINTDFFIPDNTAILKLPEITLSKENEVITYATRGMEPYRGFPEFMEAASIIQKRRPNCHIVIGGEDRICYGSQLPDGKTYKQLMLEKYDFDMDRLHFTGGLPYCEYVKLLQISSAHIYLTYPYVLSWSMLEAMSCGCHVLASSTPPVKEIIEDNINGTLFDFFSPCEIADKIDKVLNNKKEFKTIGINARKTIKKNYNLKNMLKKQTNLINQICQ